MSEIYLIRHGQASFGSDNYDRLSEKGVVQAAVLGKHLASLNVRFDALCYGEMERQEKTAEGMIKAYLEKGLSLPEPVVNKSFNEYDSTAVWDAQIKKMLKEQPDLLKPMAENPKSNAEFQKVFSKVMMRWISGKYDSEGDVIWNDFQHQVISGLSALMEKEGSKKRIAVFTSGGPICVAIQKAMGLSDMKAIEVNWQVINASVTRLKYGKNQVTLTGFNDITHLELTGDKGLVTYR